MNIEKNMSFAQEKCHFAQMAFLCFYCIIMPTYKAFVIFLKTAYVFIAGKYDKRKESL